MKKLCFFMFAGSAVSPESVEFRHAAELANLQSKFDV